MREDQIKEAVHKALDTALERDQNMILKTHNPWAIATALADADYPDHIPGVPAAFMEEHVRTWQQQFPEWKAKFEQ
jgi:hypothetical protein